MLCKDDSLCGIESSLEIRNFFQKKIPDKVFGESIFRKRSKKLFNKKRGVESTNLYRKRCSKGKRMCLIKVCECNQFIKQQKEERDPRIIHNGFKTHKLVPVPVSARWIWQNNFPILSVLNDSSLILIRIPFFYVWFHLIPWCEWICCMWCFYLFERLKDALLIFLLLVISLYFSQIGDKMAFF